jgi:hypothetical protein
MAIEIKVQADSPPVVRVFANTFRLTLSKPEGEALINSMQGVFALKSSKDPQAMTVKISGNVVALSAGVASDAQIVVTANFDNPAEKPQIEGLFRHPLLAYKVGKLMDLPLPNWADSAKRFWAATSELPDMPDAITVFCTNEDRSLTLGEGNGLEVHGKSGVLEQLFAGNSLLAGELASGRIRMRNSSLREVAAISSAGQKIMLGELHG